MLLYKRYTNKKHNKINRMLVCRTTTHFTLSNCDLFCMISFLWIDKLPGILKLLKQSVLNVK